MPHLSNSLPGTHHRCIPQVACCSSFDVDEDFALMMTEDHDHALLCITEQQRSRPLLNWSGHIPLSLEARVLCVCVAGMADSRLLELEERAALAEQRLAALEKRLTGECIDYFYGAEYSKFVDGVNPPHP